MLSGKRFFMYAGVLALCVLAVAGCSKKRSRSRSASSTSNEIFTTDSFPGQDVQSGNVADDQRAMSVSGEDVQTGTVRAFHNGDLGTMIVTYLTNSSPGRLYAHYFDGSVWSPPVALAAVDCNLTQQAANTAVAFINTDDDDNSFAQDRNGDALVFWVAPDAASATVGDTINTCLWSTYFDVTHSGEVAANYGFQTFASRVSTIEDGDNNAPGDEAVSTYGLISDGLCGEARWFSGGNNYSWGDQTNDSIIVFWRQLQDNDTVLAGFNIDQYIATSRFDLNAAIDAELPLTPSANSRLVVAGFGASDSGVTSEETQVDTQFITYNNDIFYRMSSTQNAGSLAGDTPATILAWTGTGANADTNIQVIAFNLGTGAASVPATLLATTPSSLTADTNYTNADWPNTAVGFNAGNAITFGSDEGLAELVQYNLQLTNDPTTASFGGVAPETDARYRLTQINEGTGAIIAGLNIDVDDSDTTGTLLSDGSSRFFPMQGSFEVRISRNGDYIFAAWFQGIDAGVTGSDAIADYRALWLSQHITTRIDEDGTFPVLPSLASATSIGQNVEVVVTNFRVLNYEFQTGLGYVCGVQSNPDVMNLVHEHSDVTTGDTLFRTRMLADLDVTGGTVPVYASTAFESFQEGDQFTGNFVNFTGEDFNHTDSGADGDVFIVYRQDIDFLAPTDMRLFAERTGVGAGEVEIDTANANNQVGNSGSTYQLVVTPPGSEIGRFDLVDLEDDAERTNAAQFVHVLFFESRFSDVDGLPFAYRTREYDAQSDETFGDTFSPNAGTSFTAPFTLDLPSVAPTGATAQVGLAVTENTVGLWFTEGFRIYYQEANPDQDDSDDDSDVSWVTEEGLSNPFLVDDDQDEEILSVQLFVTRSCTCDELDGAAIFWLKFYGTGGSGSTSNRLQVRVRDGGNDD